MKCAYCDDRRAVHQDHVLPKSAYKRLRRRVEDLPEWLFDTVAACFDCNIGKGTRLLIPPSWADRLGELNALGIGIFRVWHGDAAMLRINARDGPAEVPT